MAQSKEKIKKLLADAAPTIFQRYNLDLAYLFGSANSGRFGPRSDIDIAIRFKPQIDKHDFLRLSSRLETELIKLLQHKIDIAIINLANPLLRYEVVKNGSVLYSEDEEQRALFHIKVYGDYEDFCHAQDFYIKAMKERLLGEKL